MSRITPDIFPYPICSAPNQILTPVNGRTTQGPIENPIAFEPIKHAILTCNLLDGYDLAISAVINDLDMVTAPLKSFPTKGKSGDHGMIYSILPDIATKFIMIIITFIRLVLSAYLAITGDKNMGKMNTPMLINS